MMRTSLVFFFFCLVIVAVHSAAITKRGTSKAPVRQSAYAYLRTVRGKNSCAGGTCPFWQKHGRSFVSLRCYSEQYQECVCLHRMCYRSCLFDRNNCDEEMVSCLQQICRRCLPAASAATVCPAQEAMASAVLQSLKNFACYSCCTNAGAAGSNRNNSSNTVAGNTVTTPPSPNGSTRPGNAPVAGSAPATNGGQNTVTVRPNGNTNRPNNGGNTPPTNGGNRPINGANTNRPNNGNQGSNNGPLPANAGSNGQANGASVNQRVKKTASTKRRLLTTTKRRSIATVRPTTRRN